ncbi:hypothetical protein L6164_000671 [Bauhinia variegata]|uniref:Uncharacterized protein n=1 Tax=Bauhinia variegata TaxID=167791 RepID=A0ACB9Q6N3_BAUVA|nr:hypothetical protein L6164_000671 [Bauhinia variegata]
MFSNFSLFASFLCRHLSTATNLPNLSKLPVKHRKLAIREAQKALVDYLHGTRSLPFAYAEYIGRNSLLSLDNLISKVEFSPSSFPKSFKKFLRYHPINEFEFFFESIGIDYNDVPGLLPVKKFFFSEDKSLLDAASALSDFGFPWKMLGMLYRERSSIFRRSALELKSKLGEFIKYGFSYIQVAGICFAFPHVLSEQGQAGTETDALFTDLKTVFLDFGLAGSVELNVDAWYGLCRKIRVFYDLYGGKGKMGELLGRNKNIFIEHSEEEIIQKVVYFRRFSVNKEEVALLLLQGSELLKHDLETPVISVFQLLEHLDLGSEDLKDVSENYPHVLGMNKMVNLPDVLRALNLHEWFFNKIKDGNHQLLLNYITSYPIGDPDKEYLDGLESIRVSRTPAHTFSKLDYLHGLGFGQNAMTLKILSYMHGSRSKIQERFDCMLSLGIEFSKLCRMITISPKILNQNPKALQRKVNYLVQGMGTSLEYLSIFPAYLNFDLEKRIKPRYRFHLWMIEKGLSTRDYSISSLIASSEKLFVNRAFKIHPAAPKHWFEQFARKVS